MTEYCSGYIKNYTVIVEPPTLALKNKNKKGKITWCEEMRKAFELLKKKLTKEPILYGPNYDLEFVVQTDALDKEIGVVLAQSRDVVEGMRWYTPYTFWIFLRNTVYPLFLKKAIIYALSLCLESMPSAFFTTTPLAQRQGSEEHRISYLISKHTDPERNFSSLQKEISQ